MNFYFAFKSHKVWMRIKRESPRVSKKKGLEELTRQDTYKEKSHILVV